MGERGPRERPENVARRRKVWQVYLMQQSLGYVPVRNLARRVARLLGMTKDFVTNTVTMTLPEDYLT